MKNIMYFFLVFAALNLTTSCNSDDDNDDPILGCMDSQACNYN